MHAMRMDAWHCPLRQKEILLDTPQGDFQMSCQLIYFCRLHFHFITQGVAFQFKRARGRYHARVIRYRFAHKMDSHQGVKNFDSTNQYLTTTNLCAGQL